MATSTLLHRGTTEERPKGPVVMWNSPGLSSIENVLSSAGLIYTLIASKRKNAEIS